ncbi:MAG: hypothetical protein ACTHJ2_04145 [Candidatus Nitrosocosmicus sp.]
MSPFGFFNKKDKKNSNFINNTSERPKHSNDLEVITIEIALEKIKDKEENLINDTLKKLTKICEETKQSFEIINSIAEKIESEKSNEISEKGGGGGEEKLIPLINNTRNIITKSLKRESSNVLHIPETFDDLVKFKDTLDSSIKRFGEVTRSHSIVINNFMKKHANNLRSELKKITEKSEKINENYIKVLEDKNALDECKNNLLSIINKRAEISNKNKLINSVNQRIKEKEKENQSKEHEIKQLQELPSYIKSLSLLKEIERLEERRKELLCDISDTTSQISKAAQKYSYGGSRATKEIINTLINEPIKLIEDKEISYYISFLNNLKESINKNQIVVKDSSKVIQFCDRLSERLPKFKEESTEILLNIKHLKDQNKDSPLEKIRKIENCIKENKKDIQDEILRKEDLNSQKTQEEERLKKITEKTEEQLFYLLKKRYEIE